MNNNYIELNNVENRINNITYLIIIVEVLFVVDMLSLTPILGPNSSSFSQFAVYVFILTMFYIPLIISRKFLLNIRGSILYRIKQDKIYEQARSERIFTEKERTYNSYNDYNNYQSQQKSEFYANKNIKSIIHEKELKILNLELKELKFYNKGDIKTAYRKVAKENHPDFGKNEQDIKARTERMFAINSAYEILLKKVK